MFDSKIEKKIIEFIKKSPIGVTSSEIGKFLGLNRMTITKYLAIIKEKAKIDFKQFGMAKIWYIPVDLNRTKFLKQIITGMCETIEPNLLKEALEKSSTDFGKEVSDIYKKFHNTTKLTKTQLIDSIIDAMNKLGAHFSLISQDKEKIVFRNSKCLFGSEIKKCPLLCITTSSIVGKIIAENLGYSRVELKRSIANGANEDIMRVYLNKELVSS
jgi:predicted ArsR family transcriptional regulator